jgi:hypothetical protein
VAITTWLIDKSAYTRLPESPDAQVWVDRIERGVVRISTVTRLEIGYSFRTAVQARSELVSPPRAHESVDMISEPGLTLTLYAAEPASPTAQALDLLASWTASQKVETPDRR